MLLFLELAGPIHNLASPQLGPGFGLTFICNGAFIQGILGSDFSRPQNRSWFSIAAFSNQNPPRQSLYDPVNRGQFLAAFFSTPATGRLWWLFWRPSKTAGKPRSRTWPGIS